MSLHNFLLSLLRSHIKNECECLIRGSKHLETIKALGLRPRAFISFSVFGTPDEILAPVFDILRQAFKAPILKDTTPLDKAHPFLLFFFLELNNQLQNEIAGECCLIYELSF